MTTYVISNSNHIILNTSKPTRVPNTTLEHTSLPDVTMVSDTLYNLTWWTTRTMIRPIINTVNIRHDYRLQQNRHRFTNYKKLIETYALGVIIN